MSFSNLHKEDSEMYILAECLSCADSIFEVIEELNTNHFSNDANKLIFSSLVSLYKKNLTPSLDLVFDDLKGSLGTDIAKYLISLRRDICSENIKRHIDALKEAYRLRKILSIATKISREIGSAENSSTGLNSTELSDKYSRQLLDLQEGEESQSFYIKDILKNFKEGQCIEEVILEREKRALKGENLYDGVKSYYKKLDSVIGAFQNKSLTYIGARTSVGKTAFLLNLINNITNNEKDTKLGFISLEMPRHILVEKLVCMKAGVSYKSVSSGVFKGSEKHAFLSACNKVSNNLIIDDRTYSLDQAFTRIRKMVLGDKVKAIFIDYLTFIKCNEGNSMHERVNLVSKGLQSLAKELNIPIICLAQLNRNPARTAGQKPSLSDFRESGSIEEDCDLALLLSRPSKDDPTCGDVSTHVTVAKNRMLGGLKSIRYFWDDSNSGVMNEEEPVNAYFS